MLSGRQDFSPEIYLRLVDALELNDKARYLFIRSVVQERRRRADTGLEQAIHLLSEKLDDPSLASSLEADKQLRQEIAARRRAEFLVHASYALNSFRGVSEASDQIVQFVIPDFAEGCFIELL